MVSFFIDVNRFILRLLIQMTKIYIFIGLILTALIALLIIIYKLWLPDQFHDFMAEQFINISRNNSEDYELKPEDVTNGDILFLCILVLFIMVFVWPYGIMCLISNEQEVTKYVTT